MFGSGCYLYVCTTYACSSFVHTFIYASDSNFNYLSCKMPTIRKCTIFELYLTYQSVMKALKSRIPATTVHSILNDPKEACRVMNNSSSFSFFPSVSKSSAYPTDIATSSVLLLQDQFSMHSTSIVYVFTHVLPSSVRCPFCLSSHRRLLVTQTTI